MSTSQNLNQMLTELRAEIAKQTGELTTKAMELSKIEDEKKTIEKELTEKEKEKEEARRKIDAEIVSLKNKIPYLERTHRRVAEELTKIRLDQSRNNMELLKIQRESQEAMRHGEKK